MMTMCVGLRATYLHPTTAFSYSLQTICGREHSEFSAELCLHSRRHGRHRGLYCRRFPRSYGHRHSPKALQQSWRRATSTACKTLGTRAIAIRKLNLVAILKPTLLKAGPSPNSPVPARLSHGRGKGSAYSNSCFRPGLPSNRYRPTLPSHSVGPTLPSHSVGPTLPSYSVGPTLPSHSVGPTLPSYSVGYLWCMGRCQER